jgi:hypothetical protein
MHVLHANECSVMVRNVSLWLLLAASQNSTYFKGFVLVCLHLDYFDAMVKLCSFLDSGECCCGWP